MSDVDNLYLVAVETAHIQSYIFNSNRLQENIGASHLVAAVTDMWAREAVQKAASDNNLNRDLSFIDERHIETDPMLQAEVLYAGGGNFVCLFRNRDFGRDFARLLTGRVLLEAPGLRLVVHGINYRWSAEPLTLAVKCLLRELKLQRSRQPLSIGLAGLGVTAMCDSTSMPAVTVRTDEEGKRFIYSAEVSSKYAMVSTANRQLARILALDSHYLYPYDFDNLGRSQGEKSFIAVVHIDGNGIGRLVENIANRYNTVDKNREYIRSLREFSEQIKLASNHALQATMQTLQAAFDRETGELIGQLNTQTPMTLKRVSDRSSQFYFPFRPLIFGGDDVTFVCDGRIGISVAVEFIRQFEEATRNVFGEPLSACAGIAIIKVHYPFARAYELSEALCQEAKKLARSINRDSAPSAIDWHFTTGGLFGSLKDIRNREYAATPGLTLRPVLTKQTNHVVRTWSLVERVTTEFQTKWSGSRSKAKTLAGILRQGQPAVQAYEARYLKSDQLSLPALSGFVGGWNEDGFCGYFDALELMDLHIPLATIQSQQETPNG